MNVYAKIQKARVDLQCKAIKPSGRNTFANYTYLELGDFMPAINNICEDVGLCGVINFAPDIATLKIVNTEDPNDFVCFGSPMATAELKGCHPVQNLGAVQSYLRRYLWMAAFEIVEHDALDATNGKKDKEKQNHPIPESNPTTGEDGALGKEAEKVISWLDSFLGPNAKDGGKPFSVDFVKNWFSTQKEVVAMKQKMTAQDLSRVNSYFSQIVDALGQKQPRPGVTTAQPGEYF